MKVGYIFSAYPERRCIINCTGCKYIFYNIRKDIIYILKSILQKIGLLDYWDKQAVIYLPCHKCDLWHTFNQIPKTKTPHVITFETAIPRNSSTIYREWEWTDYYDLKDKKSTRRQIELLVSDTCKRILPISNNAYNIQINQLKKLGCDERYIKIIQDKMEVIYPPQNININQAQLAAKISTISKRIEFIFIGNDFFRKGGNIVIECLKKYLGNNQLHLTIISSFTLESVSGYTGEDQRRYLEYIRNQKWIDYYNNIENSQVLDILKKMHIGFLPTMQDTFGYSVLEMQATGIPVITTDIRALSEINDNTCGWVVNVDKHYISKEVQYRNETAREKLKDDIYKGVLEYLDEIMKMKRIGNIEYFRDKAENSIKRIKKFHAPDIYSHRITSIYNKAL